MNIPVKGFFAYPSSPKSVSESIQAATAKINNGNVASIKVWEDCRVGGKLIVEQMCKEIDEAELFCADLTNLNPNVMFELGYAIARNKRIWLVLDTSLVEARKRFEQLRILTTIGYASYCNSRDIESAFYKDSPFTDLHNTIFETAIKPSLPISNNDKLVYLKNRHNTEASIRISKCIEDSKLPVIIDDPRESSVQSLTWYGTQIYGCHGVVCHFSHPEREGAALHNARYALVAGIAQGIKVPLLMLEEGDFFIPIDYRDLLKQYHSASQAQTYLDEWLHPIKSKRRSINESSKQYEHSLELASELRAINIGEYVAENEADRLAENYFVETSAFTQALNGKTVIFAGRKGAGKTAILIKLADTLRSDTRNLVCVIKPIAYELAGVVELLKRYKELDQKGYVIESLWKYLLYSEIARSAVHRIQRRPSGDIFSYEEELLSVYSRDDYAIDSDFTVRLERCVDKLLNEKTRQRNTPGAEAFRIAISEAIHSGVLGDLRNTLVKALRDIERVAILVDNLDKAWTKRADLPTLSEFLLGLLSAARRVPGDFSSSGKQKSDVIVSLAVFLRSDIFYQLMTNAREPDKIPFEKLSWQDPELLMRVIDERLVANQPRAVHPAEVWRRYFTESVNGVPVREYILSKILPRPRDLVFLVKSAVSIAINRKHTKVQEIDLIEAQKQYSQYAVDSILVEDDVAIPALEQVIYEFVGSKPVLTQEEVNDTILKAGVPFSQVAQVVEHLCALAFLGIEVEDDTYRFAEDFQEYQKLLILKKKRYQSTGGRLKYRINVPFWDFLEVCNK
ncbi:hypothetical protein YTPLAS18_20590 [Nitrospira sp.]|nr:hypothetical protein YTPLAS18_20590 [Nitrospira sp.]